MKKIFLITSVVAISSILPCVALASDAARPAKEAKTSQSALAPKHPPKPKSVFVTGSYIKQTVRPDGTIPSGPSPLRVIDSKEIQASGASDLVQLLIRRGYNR